MSSRFQVLETPVVAPGKCIVCGASKDGKRSFIDLGLQVEFIGAIYFCTFCITEASKVLQFIPAKRLSSLKEEVIQYRLRIDELERHKEILKNAIHVLAYDIGVVGMSVDDLVSRILSHQEGSREEGSIDQGTDPESVS